MKPIHVMQPRTLALLIALAIGFGLAFHPLFFLVATAVVLIALGQWTADEFRKFVADFRKKGGLRA